MQVLKERKVKFDSAVSFTFWLLSGSVSSFLTTPGLIVLYLGKKKKKKKPPVDFKPARPVLQVCLDSVGKVGLGSVFSLSCGSARMVGQSGLH